MFTVTPGSSETSLVLFHAAHTELLPLLVNCGVLSTLGMYHFKTMGQQSFLRLFGAGCLAASIAVGASRMVNPDQKYTGHIGASAALLGYHAFHSPAAAFRHVPYIMYFSPMGLCGLTLLYGIMKDDKAALAGLGAGYLAFLACL